MSRRKTLEALVRILNTHKPRTWVLDDWTSFYIHAATVLEFHTLQTEFEVLTGERPSVHDTPPLSISEWQWKGWRISLSVYEDALQMEPTA